MRLREHTGKASDAVSVFSHDDILIGRWRGHALRPDFPSLGRDYVLEVGRAKNRVVGEAPAGRMQRGYVLCICGGGTANVHGGLTLAITWPHSVLSEANCQTVAAQVNGDVRIHSLNFSK